MKLSNILTLSLFSIGSLAAKKQAQTQDRFQEFRSQSLSTPSIKLDDTSYSKLTSTPRDYAVAVLLTALDARFGCTLCHEFQPEWDLVAKSWTKGDKNGESRLFFGSLDFLDGKATFQSLMLQTAPVLLFFPPTTGPNMKTDLTPVRLDFTTGPHSAEAVHSFLSRHLPESPHPPVNRPFNWVKAISIVTAILGIVSLITVAAPYIMPVIQNRNLWAAISLISVLLFTSGHMFNHIRKVPYVASDGKGGISYFAGGFQSQWGMETQIIAAVYGILSFSAISLALKVPRMADKKAQQAAVFIWGAVSLGMYSFLLSVFRIKNGGYPFYLPPF